LQPCVKGIESFDAGAILSKNCSRVPKDQSLSGQAQNKSAHDTRLITSLTMSYEP
jgi:hypothetical protein